VRFVLSWSLFNALACGAVLELIRHKGNGLLAGFFDVGGLAALSLDVLRDPQAFIARCADNDPVRTN